MHVCLNMYIAVDPLPYGEISRVAFIGISWKKHAATYQVRWDFEVWQDIKEIWYTVCMRDCWITYLKTESPENFLLYYRFTIHAAQFYMCTYIIFQMTETSAKHFSFDFNCGFARCTIRELTHKIRNATTMKNQRMTRKSSKAALTTEYHLILMLALTKVHCSTATDKIIELE